MSPLGPTADAPGAGAAPGRGPRGPARVAPPRPTSRPTSRPAPSARAALAHAARRLGRDEAGGLTVEAVFVVPLLLWALAATHVFWDGFRSVTTSHKATYTISDLISRRSTPLDQPYLDGMRRMLDALAGGGRAGPSARDGAAALRVSVARLAIDQIVPVPGGPDRVETTLVLDWSRASGDLEPATGIEAVEAHIPRLAPGDQILVLETAIPWSPLMALGLAARRIEAVSVTRSRVVGQTCWEVCAPR